MKANNFKKLEKHEKVKIMKTSLEFRSKNEE